MHKPTRKRRTRAHVIADRSVNHVERYALICGFVVERMTHDCGIDLELFPRPGTRTDEAGDSGRGLGRSRSASPGVS
jgi:hypothetical protein